MDSYKTNTSQLIRSKLWCSQIHFYTLLLNLSGRACLKPGCVRLCFQNWISSRVTPKIFVWHPVSASPNGKQSTLLILHFNAVLCPLNLPLCWKYSLCFVIFFGLIDWAQSLESQLINGNTFLRAKGRNKPHLERLTSLNSCYLSFFIYEIRKVFVHINNEVAIFI